MVLAEESARAGASGPGFAVHTDIIVPYISSLGTDEQKQRWLPGCVSGDLVTAIAMTEPGAGSDLQGIRTSAVDAGDHYVLNGSKTFISNGIMADLVIVVCRDRAPTPATTASRCWSSSAGWRASSAGATSTRWASTPRTPPSCRSPTCGAQGQPARRRGLGLRLADGEPAPGADLDRLHRGRRGGARPRPLPGLRQGAGGLRQADREVPAQPLRAGRDGDGGPHRAGLHQRLRAAPQRRRGRHRARLDGEVVDHRAAKRWSTRASSCTAATAT